MKTPKKPWPCLLCEKRYAELEQAEVCERGHSRERERDSDDGESFSDPRDERDERRHG